MEPIWPPRAILAFSNMHHALWPQAVANRTQGLFYYLRSYIGPHFRGCFGQVEGVLAPENHFLFFKHGLFWLYHRHFGILKHALVFWSLLESKQNTRAVSVPQVLFWPPIFGAVSATIGILCFSNMGCFDP